MAEENENKNESTRVAVGKRPDYVLLFVGIALLLIPLVFVLIEDTAYDKAGLYLRIIAALGAGLVGGCLPGFLRIELPFARAGGTIAIFLLVYAVDPPRQSVEAISHDAANADTRNVSPQTSSQTEWETVLGISWVKPSDWLGRHYFLTIENDLYVWPTKIDDVNKKASFIINTNHTSRTSGKIIVNNVWLEEGRNYVFQNNNVAYRLTLVDIRQAGALPTDATYIKVEKQK